jgi:excinuclease ABC subunit B
MERAISETERRRTLQMRYNKAHGIKPETVRSAVRELMEITRSVEETAPQLPEEERQMAIGRLEEQMLQAAADLDFERAARFRDQMLALKGETPIAPAPEKPVPRRRGKKRG